ncbi:MAG: hypothetical protein LBN27_06410 [Prevotellaceae bacterium]|jgi:hypothetical protein|nr:hypothetical protein [Prevotellaceae bacterium]
MKTKFTVKKMFLAAVLFATTAVSAQVVYKGLRVPQMSTSDRTSIGAETNPANAKGQQIFNLTTGKMEYWNGTKWVSDTLKAGAGNGLEVYTNGIDSVYYGLPAGDATNKVLVWNDASKLWEKNTISAVITETTTTLAKSGNDFVYTNETGTPVTLTPGVVKAGGKYGITVTGSETDSVGIELPAGTTGGQVLKWNGTDAWAAGADNNTEYTAGRGLALNGTVFSADSAVIASIAKLEDTDTKYSAGRGLALTGTTFAVDSAVIAGIAKLEDTNTTYTAGTNITIDGSNVISSTNTTYTAGTGLTLTGTQFSLDQAVVGAQIHDSLANVINTKVDTIANRGGLTIDKSDDKNYKVGLVAGTAANQIMKWNNTTSKWELTTVDELVKSVSATTNTAVTFNSHLFYGEIAITDANTKIVSITPNIAGDADFIAENFDISVSARVVGSNKIVWTLRVKNDNINSALSATVNGVTINYISTDNLADTTAFTTKTFIGQ